MKHLLSLLVLLAPAFDFSQTASISSSTARVTSQKRSFFRVGVLGSLNVTPPNGSYINTSNKDTTSGIGGTLLGLGDGMFSFEAGVAYVRIADILVTTDPKGNPEGWLTQSQYVGYPAWVKWNYIVNPLETFFVKAGAIPLSLRSNGTEVAEHSTLLVLGFGGTAEVARNTSFILDISGLRKLKDSDWGIPKLGLNIGAGFSYEL